MKERFDIDAIVKYIVKNYPKSCLAYNKPNNDSDNDGWTLVSINDPTLSNSPDMAKSCEDFFYFEKLNWCGCGSPESVKREIMKYFSILDWWHDVPQGNNNDHFHKRYKEYRQKYHEAFGVYDVFDNPLLLALAYSMDAAGFTEHGSSIRGAWLTEEGEMFLYLLQLDDELAEEKKE